MSVIDIHQWRAKKNKQTETPEADHDTVHESGHARCMACNYEWNYSCEYPPPAYHQCPNCKHEKGISIGCYTPVAGTLRMMCCCGNEYFQVLQDGYFCPKCGRTNHPP